MSLLAFAPLALLGLLALTAGLISLAIGQAERRRARLFAPRRRISRFRPVVIDGGKQEPPAPTTDAPPAPRKIAG